MMTFARDTHKAPDIYKWQARGNIYKNKWMNQKRKVSALIKYLHLLKACNGTSTWQTFGFSKKVEKNVKHSEGV